MKVRRRVLAAVIAALGLVSLGLAAASATVWRPDDVVTARATTDAAVTLVVAEPGMLGLVGAPTTITATRADGGPVAIAVGREVDVRGWVGDDAHVTISGLGSWTSLTTSDVAGSTTPVPEPEPSATGDESPEPTETPAASGTPAPSDTAAPFVGASGIVGPDPSGSDMWLAEATGDGTATLRWDAPAERAMVLVASTGDGATPPAVTLSWPRDVSTPWLVPGIVLGVVLLLAAAAVLYGARLPELAARVVPALTRGPGATRAPRGARSAGSASATSSPSVASSPSAASAASAASASPAAPAGTPAPLPGATPTAAAVQAHVPSDVVSPPSRVSVTPGAPAPASSSASGASPETGADGVPLTRRELRERAERARAEREAAERGKRRPRTGMLPVVRARTDAGPTSAAPDAPAEPAAAAPVTPAPADDQSSARADAWRKAWGFGEQSWEPGANPYASPASAPSVPSGSAQEPGPDTPPPPAPEEES